jgi:FixJ family two-component response regulator
MKLMNKSNFMILIADDDDAVRDSLKLVLGTLYDDVRDFSSGAELLEVVEDYLNSCLILDIHMPDMSGLDVIEALADRELRIPTILMTGRTDSHLRSRAETYGVVALLDKPLEHDKLISAIESGRQMLAGGRRSGLH